uniref:Ground-like domain-containing protein n=1 Tax=Rhabditophanes sp. KR3021 TaxID=114890 RepID=A0AC35TLP0_9BILA
MRFFTIGFFLASAVTTVFSNCGCMRPYPVMMPPPCPMAPPPIQMPCFCPPPPIPPPIMCPLPIPCPAPYIPPPPMCPPPPPPMPMPMPSCGSSYAPAPIILPTYQPTSYIAPPQNDCCCSCGMPCRYRVRAKTHGSKIFTSDDVEAEENPDPTCNNEKLRGIIEENIAKDPTISKRAIQKAAEQKLFAKYNVICAKGDFTYVAYTDQYCQASVGEITCYAFRPVNTEPASVPSKH